MLSNNKMRRFLVISVVMLLALPIVACRKAAPETLSEILARAANVTLVKYDWVMTSPESSQINKVWVKGNKWRVEHPQQGQTVEGTISAQGYLIDTDANTVYIWYSPGNIIEKSVIAPGEVTDFVSAMTWTKMIARSNPKIIGTETTDGKVCLVVEYVQGEITGKAWIWGKYPFLVRMELATTERKTTIEFKNIEFSNIPDSMFELP